MRRNAAFAGTMFLVATVASITGGALIESAPADGILVAVGVALELVNVLAVIGIVAALWVPLSQTHPSLAVGYLGVRLLEAGACAAAAVLGLTQLAAHDEALDAVRSTLLGVAVPMFFGVAALILYVVLYRTRLVPRFIAVWGFVAALAILANAVIQSAALQPALALPIIANEVFLGVYLIARGFLPSRPDRLR